MSLSPHDARNRFTEAYHAAVVHYQGGRFSEALSSAEAALALQQEPAALNLAAACAYQLGDMTKAERYWREAIAVHPAFAEAYNNLGALLQAGGRLEDAAAMLREALKLQPDNAGALHNLGRVLAGQGQDDAAEASFTEALRLTPDFPDALTDLGHLYLRTGRAADAHAVYEKAAHLAPANPNMRFNLGRALEVLERHADALAEYATASQRAPDWDEAHVAMGGALEKLGRADEAVAAYERALQCAPESARITNKLGGALEDLGRADEAMACYRQAFTLDPGYVQAISNYGNLLKGLGRVDEAMSHYRKALDLKPDYAVARMNLGICELQRGDFAAGWKNYEARWQAAEKSEIGARAFTQPPWRGEDSLTGKTILLQAEQGLGDTLQFCRYVPLVAARGAQVILEVQKPLAGVLSRMPGVSTLTVAGDPLPAFDAHCPLMSLPLAFGTDLASVPASTAYLRSDPAHVAAWHRRLGPKTQPRVGFVWAGSPTHRDDRIRSIALADMMPLMSGGLQAITLQTEVRPGDDALLQARRDIVDLRRELQSFDDTAAILETLDLVITVDTSVAHLAGALGRPVWILLQFNPDWRWLLERTDSPWYPSARLFRQRHAGDWKSVLAEVRAALEDFIAHSRS